MCVREKCIYIFAIYFLFFVLFRFSSDFKSRNRSKRKESKSGVVVTFQILPRGKLQSLLQKGFDQVW